jgi:predicted small integral membrane protein
MGYALFFLIAFVMLGGEWLWHHAAPHPASRKDRPVS